MNLLLMQLFEVQDVKHMQIIVVYSVHVSWSGRRDLHPGTANPAVRNVDFDVIS